MTRTPTPMRRGLLVAALLLPWMGRVGAASDAIVGIWLTDDAASKVEVGAAQASDGSTVYQGKVVWLKQPTRDGQPLRDANNADAALRGAVNGAAWRMTPCTRRVPARPIRPIWRSRPTVVSS